MGTRYYAPADCYIKTLEIGEHPTVWDTMTHHEQDTKKLNQMVLESEAVARLILKRVPSHRKGSMHPRAKALYQAACRRLHGQYACTKV